METKPTINLKYGRLFTEDDVRSMLEAYEETGHNFDDLVQSGRFTFPEDEPLFVLRAQDKRALGAIRYYQDHQNPRASIAHLNNIERAVRAFEDFRFHKADRLKEPD